ncbi:MAG: glycosyltransferase family protein, partial [Myxococcota bacterium]
MRIAYGVHGYSRGHATRASAVLTSLCERHEVRIYAGGDAYDFLSRKFPVERIPSLGFSYNQNGKMSKLKTFLNNFPKALDLFRHGPQFRQLLGSMRSFGPDVVISDAEAWTHRAALALGIPRIGFDHFGVMVYCRVPLALMDRLRSTMDRRLYLGFIGTPDRVLVSSFYDVPPNDETVQVIGPLLRDEVHHVQPRDGDHLLVYLNNGVRQMNRRLEGILQSLSREVRLYGAGRVGREGQIDYRPPGNLSFLRDLATCKAVLSTAGNQLVGEAIHYGKPLLVMPERT